MSTEELIQQLTSIRAQIQERIDSAVNQEELNTVKLEFLSKKGPLRHLQSKLSTLQNTDRAAFGKELNHTLKELQAKFDQHTTILKEQHLEKLQQKEWHDVTLPGKTPSMGRLHPITQLRREAEDIFLRMGFEIIEPRTLDTDYHVFEALNIPSGHPARDMWDTFWTEDGYIPITHTSAMQHRLLKEKEPPIRAIVPGRCFRHEATDATHEHTFYQIEGLYIDKNVTISDLIGTLKTFLSIFYERDVQLRIQPSYFPFVEPGLEIMIDCAICKGKSGHCSTCRGKRWIELVPAGAVHPNVLTMAGLDPNSYSGFAWGMGLDRLVMIRYGIEDLRWFHSGDIRFLEQF